MNDSQRSSGGLAVVLIIVAVLLAVPCLLGVVAAGLFYVSVETSIPLQSTTAPTTAPAMPAPAVRPPTAEPRHLTLTIAADGGLNLEGVEVALDDLPNALQRLRGDTGEPLDVIVRADPAAPFDRIAEVTAKIAEAGLPFQMQSDDPSAGDEYVAPPPEQPEPDDGEGSLDPNSAPDRAGKVHIPEIRPIPREGPTVTVSVSGNNELRIDGEPTSIDQIPALIKQKRPVGVSRFVVLVEAEPSAKSRIVQEVAKVCQTADAELYVLARSAANPDDNNEN